MDIASNHPAELPPPSPPFISADDAAYWAHRQIRHPVEREFGGVILQDKDGLFRASEPRGGEALRFHIEYVLPLNDDGHPVAPNGYKVAAIYHSRESIHDEVRALGLSDSQARLILGSFSPTEMLLNIAMTKSVPVHYLSGPDGSLVKYVASGTALERALKESLQKVWVDGQPPQKTKFVYSFILECAAAGELWVVVPSAEWGGVRGRVTSTWVPGTAVTSKVEALPLCTRVYLQADKAAIAGLDNSTSGEAGAAGFVLKCALGYVATWPVPAAKPWFAPTALFPVDAGGQVRLPEQCSLQGAYATVPGRAQVASAVPQPWLYRVMFSASQLAAGIGQLQAHAGLRNPKYPSELYFQTSDRALLRYRLSGSSQEATLFVEHPQGRFNDDGSEARLRAGTLAARDYVLRVAQAAELAVLRTSDVWGAPATLTQDWQPYSQRQRPLSPAFVTADDAARYAHTQVGYGGLFNYAALILQRADQRFVVTEPILTDRPRFALDAVYPLDERGALIMLAPDCRLHALFCSRVLSDAPQGLSASEAQVAQQMFMDTDIHTVLSNRKVVPYAYLSGSVNSLIAYASQDLQTYTERELLGRVTPTSGRSAVARELADGTLSPSAFVREQAYPGRLRVVVANRLWGAVGELPEDWEPGVGLDALRLPQPPLLGRVFASAQEAVRDAHERTLDRYGRSPSGLGVVLRHPTLMQYVATPTVAAPLFDQLLDICRFSEPLHQAGFAIDSIYVSSVRLPETASAAGRWLARHFITPGDLHAALYDNFGASRLPLTQRCVVYIATLEGALLKYVGGTGDTLFGRDTPHGSANLKHQLDSAELSTAGFVLRMAESGELRVLQGSECWGEPGSVNSRWVPFSQVTRRRLSPAFASADDAARYASRRLGARRDKVYGGLILRSTAGLFVATEPLVVHVENFDVQWVRSKELVDKGLFLGGSTVVGFYHNCSAYEPQFPTTDTQWNVYRNMFSTAFVADVLRAFSWEAASSPRTDYLLCNDGALLRYRFDGSAAQKALMVELNVAAGDAVWHLYNPLEEQIRGGTLQPVEWVNRLAEVGELRVLEGSHLWGAARRVESFRPYSEEQGFAQEDTGFSPLFTQPQDAARYLHRVDKDRSHLAFSYVLKASSHEHYMATQPLPLTETADWAFDHVFAGGSYRRATSSTASVCTPRCTRKPRIGA